MERELWEELAANVERTLETGKRWDGRELSDDNLIILALVCGVRPFNERSRQLAGMLPLVAIAGE